MFGLFRKNPLKKLEAEYSKLLEQGVELQRKGDIQGFASKTSEAEAVLDQIKALEAESGKSAP